MTWLITSDIHLSDRPKDAYRFGLFHWLRKQQIKYKTTATFILGDITDYKDRHPSSLVNRTVDGLTKLEPPVFILKGNHDFVDPNNPFFGFLSAIEGVHFVTVPTQIPHLGLAFVPYCQDQADFDDACQEVVTQRTTVMLHQTFEGAIAESGRRLSGLSTSLMASLKPVGVYSGDIHKPQQSGCVTYVGAPYSVRFGDNFEPRVLLVNDGQYDTDLHFPAPRKWSLRIKDPLDLMNVYGEATLHRGDQVKVTMELTREELVEWPTLKAKTLAVCKELGVDVYGVEMELLSNTPRQRTHQPKGRTRQEILEGFCQTENVASNIKRVGEELIS